jgi:hypothetical protein
MYDVKAKGLVQSICVNYISMAMPKTLALLWPTPTVMSLAILNVELNSGFLNLKGLILCTNYKHGRDTL